MANYFKIKHGFISTGDGSITGTLDVSAGININGDAVATQAWVNSLGLITSGSVSNNYLPLSGGTLTGTLTLSAVNPRIDFNGTVDAGVDMAIVATPEGLDFIEPEQTDKIHFQILDDAGVNAPYGYSWNGQSLDLRYAAASHTHSIDQIEELQEALDGKQPAGNYLTSLPSHNHDDRYVKLSGSTMGGDVTWTSTGRGLQWTMNTDGAYIRFYNTGDSDTNSRLEYGTTDNGNEYHRFMVAGVERMAITAGGISATGYNKSNWDTAYGWGNHSGLYDASGSAATAESNAITHADRRIEEEVLPAIPTNNNQLTNGAGYITDGNTGWNNTYGFITASSNITGNAATATKLATARNIALSGAVTGNANFDGSGNITISTTATSDPTLTLNGDASGSATFTNLGNATLTVTVANDSHTHDGRYYTESESDARFVNVTGDTITGDLHVSGASLGVTSTAQGTEAFYVDGVNGRLFTISDDLSDSLFSVNTISGLPVIEAFADNTVKIGPFSNPVTIDSSGVLAIGGVTAATQTYVDTAITNLIGGAPGALNTLNELAAAINDNASYASSVTSALALKAPLASPALTGNPTAPTQATSNNSTRIATTAFVKAQGYVTTDTNYYLNGISRSGNVLTFSVAGATNQTYTFGSAAWSATSAFDAAGSADAVNTRIEEEVLPLFANYQVAGNYFTDGDTVLNMANNDGLVYNDSNNLMYIKADGTNYPIIDSRGGSVNGTLSITGGNHIAMSNGNITGVNQITINDPGEGIIWSAGSSGDITLAVTDDASDNILNLSGTGASLAVNGSKVATESWVAAQGYVTSTGANYYLSGASFNTGNGVLTLTVTGASNVTVDLDGRFALGTDLAGVNDRIDQEVLPIIQTPAITSNGSTPSLNSGISAAEVRSLIGAQASGSYLTSYSETDTLATVTSRGNTTSGSINVHGDILLTGSATTTNKGRMIDFTGFDKEGTTDYSDRAYIQHTTGTGGHSGSVLVISSMNDSNDGIAFLTNASSKLKHNSNNIATENWVTSQSYLTTSGKAADADLFDGYDSTKYFRARGGIGENPTVPGSTNGWPMNPNGGTYTTVYEGHGGTVLMSNDVGGSAGSVGIEATYYGDMYVHSNVDSNQWQTKRIWTEYNFNPADKLGVNAKAADSNLLDGLDLHTGRNNQANKVVRTDSNGYIQAGWINTPSGAAGTINKIYCSQDDYVRYLTPANFRAQVTDGVYQPAGSYLTTSGKAADSNLLDGLDSSVFLRSNANDTATGRISFNAGINTLSINDTSGQQLVICAGEAGIDASQNGELVYVNAENGFQVAASNDNWATGYAGTKKTIIDYGGIRYDGNYVWHAGNFNPSSYQPAGTYNTIIGTDSDINTSGATIIDNIYVTDGVITSMGTRTLTAANLGIAKPAPPAFGAANIVGETIEVVFEQSPTSGVDSYQVWSSVAGGSYGLIANIPTQDIAATMTAIDAAFSVSGEHLYRVYAIKNGIYSDPAEGGVTFNIGALDVVNMSVVNLNSAYYIQYDMPSSRFVDHIEIYMDAEASSGSLSRSGATLIYSGNNTSYMYQIGSGDMDKFHQFWVEVVES